MAEYNHGLMYGKVWEFTSTTWRLTGWLSLASSSGSRASQEELK